MTDQKPFAPLPVTYNGKPWNVATLKALDAETMRKILRTYEASQINNALRRNK